MAFDYLNFSGLSHFYNKLKTKFSDITHTHNYAGSSSAGGVANSAVKLANAKTIQTNLGSTSAASFNGTANITPGITGTLKIANGGTGATTVGDAISNLGLSDSVLYNDEAILRDTTGSDITDDIKTILEVPSVETMESIDNAIDKLDSDLNSKPVNNNILINSNFANPVNQRGVTSNNSSPEYCIDRWKFNGTITQNNGYMNFATTTGDFNMLQYIEFPEKYSGKDLTVSMKYRVNSTNDIILELKADEDEAKKYCVGLNTDGEWHIASCSGNVASISSSLKVCVYCSLASNMDIEWIKLELGSVATPYTPRLYAEELHMCQRYYQKFWVNDAPHQLHSGGIVFTSQIPHEMRIKNVTIDTSELFININNNRTSDFTIGGAATNTTVKKLYLPYTKSAHGLIITDNIHLDGNVILDAEI